MITAPRGTYDVLPDEQPAWQHVVTTGRDVCRRYGYRPLITPTIEDTELFARTSGQGSDIVQKEMYTFEDRSGRSLTLRPEGTAAAARAYVEHGLHREPQPVKTYMVAPMFRYERPQRGRYREHWQLSVEAIGSDDPAVDAELIQLYVEVLRKLRVERYTLHLNSIGDRECRPAYLDRLEAWLDEHAAGLGDEVRAKRETNPLRVFDVKDERARALLEEAPKIGESLCEACGEHFAEVRRYLGAYGVEYSVNPTLVRGLDYYTRTTFEFLGEALGAKDSICGGGRYDYLVEEIGGPPTPGIGFGAGIERLLIQVEEEAVAPEARAERVDLFFAFDDGARRTDILPLMADLRRAGRTCEADYARRSLKGQLTQAKRLRAETTVIARADEATIRRAGRDDETVPLSQLAEALA